MPRLSLKENILTIAFLIFTLSICFYDIFFFQKTFKVTTLIPQTLHSGVYGQQHNKTAFIPLHGVDAALIEEPFYEFIKNSFKKGILPLWNPHQACGFPLIGMMQVGLFFPLNFILYFFPSIYAWDILILTRFLLAGLFTYWLMRHFRFSPIPSITSAFIFMLSGPMVFIQNWAVNVDILLPLLLLALNQLIENLRPKYTVISAIVIAMTFLAGHPEHVFLVNLYAAAFLIFRIFSLKKSFKESDLFIYLSNAYILGVGLASIVFLPFLDNYLTEFWHGHSHQTGLVIEDEKKHILSLALPYFFQTGGWWGGYLGIIPLGLTFLSLKNKHKGGLNYFFFLTAILLLGKAYGFPLMQWLGALPLFNMIRYAMHTPHLIAFSIAILSGMGMRMILLEKKSSQTFLAYSVLLTLIAGFHVYWFRQSLNNTLVLKSSVFGLGVLIIFQILLWIKDKNLIKKRLASVSILLLIPAELFFYIPHERPFRFDSFPKVPYLEFLKSEQPARAYGMLWTLFPNTATGYDINDLGILSGVIPKRFVHYTNKFIRPQNFAEGQWPPSLRVFPLTEDKNFLDLLNARYIVTPPHETAIEYSKELNVSLTFLKNLNHIYSKEVEIYERPLSFPRAFIVHEALFEPNLNRSFEFLKESASKLDRLAVIQHEPVNSIIQQLKNLPQIINHSSAKILNYAPNEVIVDTFLTHPGFLVLSDSFHPDWKAYVDGEKSTLYQTDYLIRSVFLTAGHHQVRFVFHPLSFYIGLLLSLLTVVRIIFYLRK